MNNDIFCLNDEKTGPFEQRSIVADRKLSFKAGLVDVRNTNFGHCSRQNILSIGKEVKSLLQLHIDITVRTVAHGRHLS